MWAHELSALPEPPDIVTWAKKAQNGVIFLNDRMATFFREEKKFNTTWEGDSVGMVRLMSILPRLNLEQVKQIGALMPEEIGQLAKDCPRFISNMRGKGGARVLLEIDNYNMSQIKFVYLQTLLN